MTQAVARYTVVMIPIVAVVAWLLTLALTGNGASSAIGASAAVASVVQIAEEYVVESFEQRGGACVSPGRLEVRDGNANPVYAKPRAGTDPILLRKAHTG